MRYTDILESLEEVDELLSIMKDKYAEAKEDKEQKEILKPKIKSSLVQLRSCLDYCIKDVDEIILRKNRNKVYFPYSETKKKFDAYIHERFPKLRNKSPQVYNILASIQDFNNESYPWLTILCKKTNVNKHDKHSSQKREDGHNLRIPGIINLKNNSKYPNKNIHFTNCKVEVEPGVIAPLNFSIDNKGEVVNYIPTHKRLVFERIDWVNFLIEGTNMDILEFLTTSRKEIKKMIELLYIELQKRR